MTIRFKRVPLLILAFLSATFISLAPLTPYTANAAAELPSEQLEKWLFYRGMRACLEEPDFDSTWYSSDNGSRTAAEINAGHLLPGGIEQQTKKGFGYLAPDMDGGTDNDGTVSCGDGSIFVRGATAFGFDSPVDLICAMNRALPEDDNGRITPSNPTDCESSNEFDFDGGSDAFQEALTKALTNEGSKDRPPFNINDNNGPDYSYKALLYLIGKRSLEVFCGEGATLESGASNGGDIGRSDIVSVDIVKAVSGDVKIEESQPYPIIGNDVDEITKIDDVYYNQGGSTNNAADLTCAQMAELTRGDNSLAYAAWARANLASFEEDNNNNGATPSDSKSDNAPVCSAGALGWVICPAINFIGEMNDVIYKSVESMLYIDPITVETGGPLYKTWTKFRDLANVLFVVVFLLVIFSQATSVGLSSYGIKKILPRILAAAILVNISFFICQIALDISNIVGVGLSGLVATMRSGVLMDDVALSWADVIGVALVGGGAVAGVGTVLAAGSMTAALAMILPFMVTALFAIVTALAILIARQVIIILLVALAPLAFIAIILPNTQKYFQLWQNTFTTMLVMFPLVALLFSGSQLAANIILTSASSDDGISFFSLIAAVCMMFIPLFGVPYIVKFSGGTIGRLAGMINNPNKGPFDALRKKAEGYRDFKKDEARGKNNNGIGNAAQRNTFGRFGRYERRRDAIRAGAKREADRTETDYIANELKNNESFRARVAGGTAINGPAGSTRYNAAIARARAQGEASIDKLIGEEMGAAKTVIDNLQLTNAQLASLGKTGKAVDAQGKTLIEGDFYQKSAQQQLVSTGQAGHIYGMLEAASDPNGNMSQEVKDNLAYHLAQNYSTLKAKDHTLNDDVIKVALKNGTPITDANYQSAALSKLSSVNKEVFSGSDQQGIAHLEAAIRTAVSNGSVASDPKLRKQVDDALSTAVAALDDPNTQKNWTAESRAAAEKLRGLGSILPPPPPPPTTPSSPGGGTP